jgi:hypothetical protein
LRNLQKNTETEDSRNGIHFLPMGSDQEFNRLAAESMATEALLVALLSKFASDDRMRQAISAALSRLHAF